MTEPTKDTQARKTGAAQSPETRNVVLLRVGIDSGSGGMQGPLFQDGGFEFVPIPDDHGVGSATYGNTVGRHGGALSEYFPQGRRSLMAGKTIHDDPNFLSLTYGDPTSPKAGLRRLQPGDLLMFYAGLEGWDFKSDPALYLVGFFEVKLAGMALDFDATTLEREFGQNFHVRHPALFERQKDSLLLIKGTPNSRLFDQAHLLSEMGENKVGQPLKVLSKAAQAVFGDFGGRISIQRSPPRWVAPDYVTRAAQYVRNLEVIQKS